MKKKIREDVLLWIWILVLSIIVLFSMIIFSNQQVLISIRMISGSIFVLFLPGYIITSLFFSTKEIDILEKIAISFGLSISIVPLVTFYLNFLFKLRINTLNVFIIILGIIILSFIIKRIMINKENKARSQTHIK